MKIIQSFWTDVKDLNQLKGGYPHVKHHLISWALTCTQLKKFYKNVELITDEFGRELLIDHLQLPYDRVSLSFETYRTPFPSNIWTIKKLYAYTLSESPFLHVDGDVFIWKPFPNFIEESALVAQNIDLDLSFYRSSLTEIGREFPFKPSYLQIDADAVLCSNMGIVGGRDVHFFKNYYERVITFLEKNADHLTKVNARNLSTLIEQHFYNLLAHEFQQPIKYLFEEPVTENHYPNLAEFTELPSNCNYIHLMEGKKNYSLCEMMSQRLLIENSELYEKVVRLTSSSSAKTINNVALRNINNWKINFSRTIDFLREHSNIPRKIIEYQDLKECIEMLPDSAIKERLLDVFNFEYEKLSFTESVSSANLFKDFKTNSIKLNELLMSGKLGDCLVMIAPNTKIVESSWNWCERNEFNSETTDLNNNISMDPFYYSTVLYVYQDPLTLKEHVLDPLSVLIFDWLRERGAHSTTVAELMNGTINSLFLEGISVDQSVEANVLRKIHFYLYQNILAVNK